MFSPVGTITAIYCSKMIFYRQQFLDKQARSGISKFCFVFAVKLPCAFFDGFFVLPVYKNCLRETPLQILFKQMCPLFFPHALQRKKAV